MYLDFYRNTVNFRAGISAFVCFIICLQVYGSPVEDSMHSNEPGIEESLQPFLRPEVFLMQKLWDGRGGTSIVTAQNGTVIAFHGRNDKIRMSRDGGHTWDTEMSIGNQASQGNVLVDETNGDILFVNPQRGGRGMLWRSSDHGETWKPGQITVLPDGFGLLPSSVGSMQAGITLQYGEHKGRLIMPARIMGPEGSNEVPWRAYHYSTAIYSDDHGNTWQTSKPFPVLGTGEAALAELSDGRIQYNSREHMSIGNRFIAWSHDGGDTWLDAYRCPYLPDGVMGTSYGCMGGLIRLPVDSHDILIYSNLDSESGAMPRLTGGSTTGGRERITVWASFDGGITWPLKRLVFEGPSGYSNLGVGRKGTPSEGKIYLLFEGGPEGRNSAVQLVVFNLSWMLDGLDIQNLISN